MNINLNLEAFDHSITPFVLLDSNLIIVWANQGTAGLFGIENNRFIGKPFSSFFSSEASPGDFEERLKRSSIPTERVTVHFNEPMLRDLLIERGTVHLKRLSMSSVVTGDRVFISLRQRENPLFHLFASGFRDFLMFMGDEDRVREIVSGYSIFPGLTDLSFPMPLRKVLSPRDASDLLEREGNVRKASEKNRLKIDGGWIRIGEDDFSESDNWLPGPEYEAAWKIVPGKGMQCLSEGRTVFTHAANLVSMRGGEGAVELDVEMEHPCRMGIRTHLEHPTVWNMAGYTAGFQMVGGVPYLTLKKNTLFIGYFKLDRIPGPRLILRMEYGAGRFAFFLDGRPAGLFHDPDPLPDDWVHLGLLASGPVLCRRLTLSARPAEPRPSTHFEPLRIRLPGLASRLFEVRLMPLAEMEDGLPVSRRVFHFREVTELARIEEDRDAAARVGESLKAKDYFGFIGANPKIISVIDIVEKSADTDAAVSILGPTGSGKEVLARAIHRRSRRRDAPFVKVDCSSIPAGLLESELFGHEKGAFTGAADRRIGKFESADRGTLFLDEIGNLSPATQAKLLDFLESHEISRVGGTDRMRLDVRIITATNADLQGLVKQGLFREDLYYRIQVVTLALPPLRERIDDIPILVDHFLDDINRNHKLAITGVARPVMDALLIHTWPGNVRELYNTLLTAAILRKQGLVEAAPDFSGRGASGARRTFIPEKNREARILGLLDSAPWFSARDCRKVLPVSMPTIQRDLRRLLREGRLAAVGRGPAVRYVAASGSLI